MKKLQNKAFFLAETIAVVAVVALVLAFIYPQISGLLKGYERTSSYNTVESVHAVNNIKIYINQNDDGSVITDLLASPNPLYDITSYNFDATGYYASLITNLDINKVYLTRYNVDSIITNYASYNIDAKLLDFLKTLKVNDVRNDTYRLIVVLNNGDYVSIIL